MAVIKLTKKEKLDQLVARITLQTGIKPTQQDVLDAAVDLAETHFDELQAHLSPKPLLDQVKVDRIMAIRERLSKIEWYDSENSENWSQNDIDLYSN